MSLLQERQPGIGKTGELISIISIDMAKKDTKTVNPTGGIEGDVPKIRTEYEPKGKQYDVLKYVYRRYYDIFNDPKRNEIIGNIDRWRNNWEAFRTARDPDDWQSNYFIPLTTSVI